MTPRKATAISFALLALLHVRPSSSQAEIGSSPGTAASAGEPGAIRIVLGKQDSSTARIDLAATTPPASRSSRVSFAPEDGGLLITVPMQVAGQVTLRQDDRDVLVSFPRPLPDFDAQALLDQAPKLLEAVNVGYDTLLLRLAPGYPDVAPDMWWLSPAVHAADGSEIPATSPESDALSKDLKRRGFSLVGSTIIYAYMQAVGMVNDHLVTCFRFKEVQKARPASRRRRTTRAQRSPAK